MSSTISLRRRPLFLSLSWGLKTCFTVLIGMAVITMMTQAGFAESKEKKEDTATKSADSKSQKKRWISLFDGRSLKGWEITKFGGEGDVEVKNGRLILGLGSNLTGVHTRRKLPKINYEVELEAMRVDGSDFFCGLTFPVKKDHCSMILGGWGGGVCGLSSINFQDASENETTSYRKFEKGKWYKIRLRVTENEIQAWIGKEQIVDQEITGKRISTRIEVELSKPFGFCTWQTTGALRNIRIRELDKKNKTVKK
jgi:hypothetical protein